MCNRMNECKHALGGKINEIGELCLFCEITDRLENVTLGDCLDNCESQENEHDYMIDEKMVVLAELISLKKGLCKEESFCLAKDILIGIVEPVRMIGIDNTEFSMQCYMKKNKMQGEFRNLSFDEQVSLRYNHAISRLEGANK